MPHIAGIPLASFEEPLRTALDGYVELSDGAVTFDIDAAARLEPTPDKPNSARSVTPIMYEGRTAGALALIAFKPGDGTGTEITHKLRDIDTSVYPRSPKVLPRSKQGTHSEAYLPLGSWLVDEPNTDPRLFAGNLLLLGLTGHRVIKVGELAQSAPVFQHIIGDTYENFPWVRPRPNATLTTGYLDFGGIPTADFGERFGDPHAVYNSHPEVVQAGGFIALSSQEAMKNYEMLKSLGLHTPNLTK